MKYSVKTKKITLECISSAIGSVLVESPCTFTHESAKTFPSFTASGSCSFLDSNLRLYPPVPVKHDKMNCSSSNSLCYDKNVCLPVNQGIFAATCFAPDIVFFFFLASIFLFKNNAMDFGRKEKQRKAKKNFNYSVIENTTKAKLDKVTLNPWPGKRTRKSMKVATQVYKTRTCVPNLRFRNWKRLRMKKLFAGKLAGDFNRSYMLCKALTKRTRLAFKLCFLWPPTCVDFGRAQIRAQVDARFSPFGHPTQVAST